MFDEIEPGVTHVVCNERMEKDGAKAKCCTCEPHRPCGLNDETSAVFVKEHEKEITQTCLSVDCPERSGEKCTASANVSWRDIFSTFYDKNENGGSSRWLVSPDTIKLFIEG